MSLANRTCRDNACIATVIQSVVVIIDYFAAGNLGVNLLSRTQLFLQCIAPLWRGSFTNLVCAFRCPAVFAAPQQFERIAGARLGLLGLYSRS